MGRSLGPERRRRAEPLLLGTVVRGQLAQSPRLAVNDRASLAVGFQIALIARDDVAALSGLGVGCGGQQHFEAAEHLAAGLEPRRILVQAPDTEIRDYPDHAQTGETQHEPAPDFPPR